jgi:hypothetical protein
VGLEISKPHQIGHKSSPDFGNSVAIDVDHPSGGIDDQHLAAIYVAGDLNLDHVVYAPLGLFLQHQAWRKNIRGIVKGPLPFFWGVSKTV